WFGGCEHKTFHLYSEGTRRGCRLIIEHLTNDVCILLRGTLNGLSVENTFKRRPTYHVKAPPPKLTVTEEGDKLKLSWTAPDVGLKENSWSYSINYSKCGSLQVLDGYSLDVPYDKRCRYTFQIMGNIKRDYGKGESLISEAVTHEAYTGDFLISNNFLKQKPTTVVGIPQQKMSVSITCHVPLSINYSLTTTSHAVHKSTYCLLRHGIPLFLKGGPQDIEVLGYRAPASTRPLS
uniref:Uncharacterized protein n=1 Tax=Myripristis murdjan TaxID=586833 RepID=A0A667Z024_9TELE